MKKNPSNIQKFLMFLGLLGNQCFIITTVKKISDTLLQLNVLFSLSHLNWTNWTLVMLAINTHVQMRWTPQEAVCISFQRTPFLEGWRYTPSPASKTPCGAFSPCSGSEEASTHCPRQKTLRPLGKKAGELVMVFLKN